MDERREEVLSRRQLTGWSVVVRGASVSAAAFASAAVVFICCFRCLRSILQSAGGFGGVGVGVGVGGVGVIVAVGVSCCHSC